MYEEYWRLKEKSFENTPDPEFIYYSLRHEEALSRLLYAVREHKGAAILTGEYGSGKTLLSRVLLQEMSNEKYESAVIFNPTLPPLSLIKEIIYQLRENITNLSSSRIDLLHTFNEILYENLNKNKHTVIIIDEAQVLSKRGFEELRLLLNFQLNDKFLFTLILIGQPELKIKLDGLPQLKQRLAIRYFLKALEENETKGYIQHRLKVVGAEKDIFQEDAYKEIYKFSGGIPRRINNICDMALLLGFGEKKDSVTRDMVKSVAEDLEEVPVEA